MASLTVHDLDEGLISALRIRAAERGRSAEAEHREILRQALSPGQQPSPRAAAARLAEFRGRTAGRGSAHSSDLLRESRDGRLAQLNGQSGN